MKKILLSIATAILLSVAGSAMATGFSYQNLLLAAMKQTPGFDYESHVDSYMRLFREPVWNKFRNDEFELDSKRTETIKMMKEKVAAIPKDDEFEIMTQLAFGDYDFKSETFPVTSLGPTTYYYEDSPQIIVKPFPNRYKVIFTNTEIITGLKMPKDEAKNFLAKRKDPSGNANRKLTTILKFKVVGMEGTDTLKCQLTKVVMYGDQKRTNVVATFQ